MSGLLMVLVSASMLVACNQGQENTKESVDSDPNLYHGSYFAMARIDGASFSQSGNDYLMTNENSSISIRVLPLPGLTTEDTERTRSVLDGFATGLIDVSVDPIQVGGRKALAMKGKRDDLSFRYISIAMTDAVCIISYEPKTEGSTNAFDTILASFKLTNDSYFKGFDFTSTPGNTPGKPADQVKPTKYENEFYSFITPQDWEVTAGQDGSCLVTPVAGNTNDSMQGITIDAMSRHDRESDLAFAQISGSKPASVKIGTNTYAYFSIASINTFNYIISKGEKTFLITITANTDKLTSKMSLFMNSLVFK